MRQTGLTQSDIEELYIRIGRNVKKYREEAGLTQLELSLLIGHKSVGTISVCELYKNKKHFNIEQLAKIANVLNKELKAMFE